MRELIITSPSRAYGVSIGLGAWSLLADRLAGATSVVVVSDDRVGALYGMQACEPLHRAGLTVYDWVVPAGERSKTLWQSECLYDFLASKGVDRQGVIVALGGGVVGDLAAFVASTWLRGVRFLNCPTSLLAAVDACVGGKTGLNHMERKNLIGTFYQPHAVLIDTAALHSLPQRELRCGLAESIKHAVLDGEDFFTWHAEHIEAAVHCDPESLETLIHRNLEIKARIVGCDERDETGERARLNLGHTFGHALETASGFRLSHGECVALGMVAAAHIAVDKALADPAFAARLEQLIAAAGLPVRVDLPAEPEQIVALMQQDKKTIGRELHFVLPEGPGRVRAGHAVNVASVVRALGYLGDCPSNGG